MNKKFLMIVSFSIIFLLAISAVSAEDPNSNQTFSHIQDLIDNADEGSTIELDGIYTGNGTEITIDKTLTIKGSNVILDADNKSRTFYITAKNVKLEGLTIINSYFTSDEDRIVPAGAIYNVADGLTVTNCTFKDNTVNCTYIGAFGGAILNGGANSVISNCTFINNYAYCLQPDGDNHPCGGAIFNNRTNFTVYNSIFIGNVAHTIVGPQSQSGDMGGAIYIEENDTLIEKCKFIDNSAFSGGAIYAANYAQQGPCNFVVKDSYFENNFNSSIKTFSEFSNITNCIFYNNSSPVGGAIDIRSHNISVIDGCIFANNHAIYTENDDESGCGGAIMLDSSMDVNTQWIIKNSLFTGNIADINGSAINAKSDENDNTNLVVYNSTFISNTAGNSFLIYLVGYDDTESFNAKINNCIIENNKGNGVIGASIFSIFGSDPELFNINANENYWGLNNTDALPEDIINILDNEYAPETWILMSIYGPEGNASTDAPTNFTIALDTLTDGKDASEFTGDLPVYGGYLKVNDELIRAMLPANGEELNIDYTFSDVGNYDVLVVSSLTGKELARVNVNVGEPKYTLEVLEKDSFNVNVGDTFKIKYKLSNIGTATGHNVDTIFVIPKGLEFVSASVDIGTFEYSEQFSGYVWHIDEVVVGDPFLNLTLKAIKPGNYQMSTTVGLWEVLSNAAVVDVSVNSTNASDNGVSTLPQTGNPLVALLLTLFVLPIVARKK